MALNIDANWHQPIDLVISDADNLIYECAKPELVPKSPGVYVFGRIFDDQAYPLYIGKSENLHSRLWQHLNSVALMKAISLKSKTKSGKRFYMCCEVKLKPGQQIARVLRILESSLIDHALSEGHELLNKQGTKRPAHTIKFRGNSASQCIAPRLMYVKKG